MARLRAMWSAFGRVAARRPLMVLLCGVVSFVVCYAIEMATAPEGRLPEIADEFGHLLAGDTFASGRLTNPKHAVARSLETFHILVEPTYQSPYPPGQGLFIALGQVIDGRPMTGVMISAALFAAALCWALQAWFPARWAVLGTLLGFMTLLCTATTFGGVIPGYWAHSYWGGAVAGLGGALLFGGARRLATAPVGGGLGAGLVATSVAMGVGVFLLAVSRPYEGLLACVPVGGYLLWSMWERRGELARRVMMLVPAAVTVGVGLAWMAYYNWRGTGDAFTMPYMVYRDRYQMLPIFTWQALRPLPEGLNQEMVNYAYLEVEAGKMFTQPARRLADYGRIVLYEAGLPGLVVTVVMLAWVVRRRAMWFVLGASVFVLAGMWFSRYFEFHYHAPAAVLTVVLVTAALRQLALMRRGPRAVYAALVAGVLLLTGAQAVRAWHQWQSLPRRMLEHWAGSRQEVVDTLVKQGGKHVVFVKYGARHSPHVEVVHNTANVDEQQVVWVRALEDWQNAEVLSYFEDRAAWLMLIEDDNGYAKVVPFPRP